MTPRYPVALLLCLAFLSMALADDRRTVTTAGSRLTHGDWKRLPDAGFSWTVCGDAPIQEDGGTEFRGCIYQCESGAFASAPSVGLPLWRQAAGLQ